MQLVHREPAEPGVSLRLSQVSHCSSWGLAVLFLSGPSLHNCPGVWSQPIQVTQRLSPELFAPASPPSPSEGPQVPSSCSYDALGGHFLEEHSHAWAAAQPFGAGIAHLLLSPSGGQWPSRYLITVTSESTAEQLLHTRPCWKTLHGG